MKVKIKGEITAERLAEALQKATEKCLVSPGSKFYGANLYLTAFDADGLPLPLVDFKGRQLMITLQVQSGELAIPAVTAEGVKKQKQAKAKAEAQLAERDKEVEEWYAEREQEYQLHRQKIEEAAKEFEAVNRLTARLIEQMPEKFVAELNGIVNAVWGELNPVEEIGKAKGQPKPLPVFWLREGFLFLSCNAWKNPRQVKNPVCVLDRGKITTFWKRQPAWEEVVNRVGLLMAELTSSLPPAKSGEPLREESREP